MHDKKFLQYINCLPAGCMIVFDKAYNFYLQFAKWTQEGIFFVCRLKDNAKYEVIVANIINSNVYFTFGLC